jgi:hypothetical protein
MQRERWLITKLELLANMMQRPPLKPEVIAEYVRGLQSFDDKVLIAVFSDFMKGEKFPFLGELTTACRAKYKNMPISTEQKAIEQVSQTKTTSIHSENGILSVLYVHYKLGLPIRSMSPEKVKELKIKYPEEYVVKKVEESRA